MARRATATGGWGLNDDAFIPGWRELVNALHSHGAKVAPQLIHPGFSARSAYNEGRQPVSASPIATRAVKEIPRELSLDEIERIVARFADAAAAGEGRGLRRGPDTRGALPPSHRVVHVGAPTTSGRMATAARSRTASGWPSRSSRASGRPSARDSRY